MGRASARTSEHTPYFEMSALARVSRRCSALWAISRAFGAEEDISGPLGRLQCRDDPRTGPRSSVRAPRTAKSHEVSVWGSEVGRGSRCRMNLFPTGKRFMCFLHEKMFLNFSVPIIHENLMVTWNMSK